MLTLASYLTHRHESGVDPTPSNNVNKHISQMWQKYSEVENLRNATCEHNVSMKLLSRKSFDVWTVDQSELTH